MPATMKQAMALLASESAKANAAQLEQYVQSYFAETPLYAATVRQFGWFPRHTELQRSDRFEPAAGRVVRFYRVHEKPLPERI